MKKAVSTFFYGILLVTHIFAEEAPISTRDTVMNDLNGARDISFKVYPKYLTFFSGNGAQSLTFKGIDHIGQNGDYCPPFASEDFDWWFKYQIEKGDQKEEPLKERENYPFYPNGPKNRERKMVNVHLLLKSKKDGCGDNNREIDFRTIHTTNITLESPSFKGENKHTTLCAKKENIDPLNYLNDNYKDVQFYLDAQIVQVQVQEKQEKPTGVGVWKRMTNWLKTTKYRTEIQIQSGTPIRTIDPSQITLGRHKLIAIKKYDNGLWNDSIDLHVIHQPINTIDVTGSLTPCEDESVKLRGPDAPEGINYTYEWSTGETSREITIADQREVFLTIYSDECSSKSQVFAVRMFKKPTLTDMEELKEICSDHKPILLIHHIEKTDRNVKIYIDGKIASMLDPEKLNPGQHVLTAVKEYGPTMCETTFPFAILAKPTARITPLGPTTFCANSSVTLQAPEAPKGETYTYTWSTGETSREITVSKDQIVKLSISNGVCTAEAPSITTKTILAPEATIKVQGGKTDICEGDAAILLTGVGDTYEWRNKNNEIVGDKQVLYVRESDVLKAKVSFNNGCTDESDPVAINVKSNPIPKIEIGGPLTFCEGESVLLMGKSSTTPEEWTWSNGQNIQNIVVSEPGLYSVTTRTHGDCTASSEIIQVQVLPRSEAPMVRGVTDACNDTELTLVADAQIKGHEPMEYLWFKDKTVAPFYSGRTLRYTLNGSESLFVQARTLRNPVCESEKTEVILTALNPTGDFQASMTKCPQGSKVKFASTVKGATKYEWDFGDGEISYKKDPKHYFNKVGTFTISMTAYSQEGCPLVIIKKDLIQSEGDLSYEKYEKPDDVRTDEKIIHKTDLIYPNPTTRKVKIRLWNETNQTTTARLDVWSCIAQYLGAWEFTVPPGEHIFDWQFPYEWDLNNYYVMRIKINERKTVFKELLY